MKRAFFLIPLLALSLPIAQAAPQEPAAVPAEQAQQPAADAAAATEAPKEGEAANAAAPAATDPAAVEIKREDGQKIKAVDATLRLRQKLASVDTELASLSKPSRSLEARCRSRKVTINSQLERLDKVAMDVAALQERFNSTNSKEFEFNIVHGDERDKYVRDGKAAHNAMLVDMKEKRSSRKIGGLDKFELMRERYQGMPEFKEASEWYSRTIDDLEKRWTKMQAAETMRRDRLNSAKKTRMEEDDEKDFAKLEQQFKSAGEEIAKVWYVPSARNLRMLSNCLNKVRDAKRRSETAVVKSENIGCVPELLTQFWEMMDASRSLLLKGDLKGAQKLIDDDTILTRIVRLNRNVIPDEYKEPLKEQRQVLLQEIKTRIAENTRTQRTLESRIAELERTSSNIEARIDALLEDIERERAVDAGENTASIADAELDDDSKKDQAKPEEPKPEAKPEAPKPEEKQGK